MISKISPALMIEKDDIEQILLEWSNVPQWVKVHISTRCPLHRYEGDLAIEGNYLVFRGRDIKEGKDYDVEILFDSIEEVYLGFSNCLKSSIDLTFGMGGPTPLAVRYWNGDQEAVVYFNTGFDHYVPHVTMNNRLWCERLNNIIERRRKPATRGGRLLVEV